MEIKVLRDYLDFFLNKEGKKGEKTHKCQRGETSKSPADSEINRK